MKTLFSKGHQGLEKDLQQLLYFGSADFGVANVLISEILLTTDTVRSSKFRGATSGERV